MEAYDVEAAFLFVKREWKDANEKNTKKGYKRIRNRLLTFLVKRELRSACFKNSKGFSKGLLLTDAGEIRRLLRQQEIKKIIKKVTELLNKIEERLKKSGKDPSTLNVNQKARIKSYKRIQAYLKDCFLD